MKKIFANSGTFWNWLVTSSADPQSVALTVQGFFSLSIVQTIFGLLPAIGVHPTFTLAMASSGVVSIIYTVASIVTGLVTLYGIFRKVIVTVHGLVPAPKTAPATAPATASSSTTTQ